MPSVIDGVIIGGAGGAIAGLTVYMVQHLHNKFLDLIDSKQIYNWLQENTADERGRRWRSTRAIAGYNNLTIDRVRYLCSRHQKINLSVGGKEDIWTIFPR